MSDHTSILTPPSAQAPPHVLIILRDATGKVVIEAQGDFDSDPCLFYEILHDAAGAYRRSKRPKVTTARASDLTGLPSLLTQGG